MRVLKKDIWPAVVNITAEKHTEMILWCEVNCGRRFRDWYSYKVYGASNTVIYAFKDEPTAMVFKLRWVGE